MAAGVAASAGRKVLLCERMEKPQRKVRISGKGRCNLTNMRSEAEFLKKIRRSAEFFAPALRRFSNAETVEFFRRIGVPLSVERGKRVFPASGKAWDVAEAHIGWCRRQGAEIACLTRVREIHTDGGRIAGATVQTPQGTERIAAPNVLLATGGASYPATGSSGDGYLLAHKLGHTIVEIRPSLTPLVSGLPETDRLKGLALRNVAAKLVVDGETTQQEFGELEFTPFLSGPIVLRMSRPGGRRADRGMPCRAGDRPEAGARPVQARGPDRPRNRVAGTASRDSSTPAQAPASATDPAGRRDMPSLPVTAPRLARQTRRGTHSKHSEKPPHPRIGLPSFFGSDRNGRRSLDRRSRPGDDAVASGRGTLSGRRAARHRCGHGRIQPANRLFHRASGRRAAGVTTDMTWTCSKKRNNASSGDTSGSEPIST